MRIVLWALMDAKAPQSSEGGLGVVIGCLCMEVQVVVLKASSMQALWQARWIVGVVSNRVRCAWRMFVFVIAFTSKWVLGDADVFELG